MKTKHTIHLLTLFTISCSFIQGLFAPSLDEETLNNLTLSMDSSIQLKPGGSYEFTVGTIECCVFYEPVDADVTWLMEPSEGAAIDPETGLFTVDVNTPAGSVYEVTADVENGRREVSIDVYIYTPEENPITGGYWHEVAQIECGTGEEIVPSEPIEELYFKADGKFGVTWYPFEVYQDYWGTYTYDLESGSLVLMVTGGNYTPEDIDRRGSFVLDDKSNLILNEIWLGTPQSSLGAANCGHIFSMER